MNPILNRSASVLCGVLLCLQVPQVWSQNITGAGATFPAPAYAKWAESYNQSSAVKVNYQPIGSSGGIKQIDARTVDFGATDAPLKDDELAKKGQVQFPTLIGGVVPVINVRGIEAGQLRLTGSVLADIYLGKVTRWSDPAIKALNPSLPLPDAQITPVFRTDGSGTTFIFSNYLSKVSPDWKNKAGEGANIAWPAGSGGRGNLGVAAVVSRIQNAIGYVEHAYVKQGRLKHVLVQNAAGQYIEPSTESFRQASLGVDWASSSYQILTQQPSPQAWPITGASFVLLYAKNDKPEQASQVLRFFHHGMTQGDKQVAELGYAPLPKEAISLIEKQWAQVRDSAGHPIAFK